MSTFNIDTMREAADREPDTGPTWRAGLALVRDVLARLRPEQVRHNGFWVSARTPDVVAHVGYWLADSPEGRERGLSVTRYGLPEHADGHDAFAAIARAFGLSLFVTETLLVSSPRTFLAGPDRAVVYEDPGDGISADGLAQSLGRIDAFLVARRRVLSSR